MEVSVSSFARSKEPLNEVESFLTRWAAMDGQPGLLSLSDFPRGFSEDQSRFILEGAEDYVTESHYSPEAREQARMRFLGMMAGSHFPLGFSEEKVSTGDPNPWHVSFSASFGHLGENTSIHDGLKGHPVSWRLLRGSMGVELSRRFSDSWPLFLGLRPFVSRSDGTLNEGKETLARLENTLGAGLDFFADYRIPLPWNGLEMSLIVATGFELGQSEDPKLTDKGRELIPDPCHVTFEDVIVDFDQGTDSLQCKFKKSLGGYNSWTVGAGLGIRIHDRLTITALWRSMPLYAHPYVLMPRDTHMFLLQAGVRFTGDGRESP